MVMRTPITIATEPFGSIPRPIDLIERVAKGDSEDPDLARLYEDAIRDTKERFEASGSPVVSDGEQRKYHNFSRCRVHRLPNTASDAFKIPFSDSHTRRLPRLIRGALVEENGRQVRKVTRNHLKRDQRIFVGVTTPIDQCIEAPEEVRIRRFAG